MKLFVSLDFLFNFPPRSPRQGCVRDHGDFALGACCVLRMVYQQGSLDSSLDGPHGKIIGELLVIKHCSFAKIHYRLAHHHPGCQGFKLYLAAARDFLESWCQHHDL